MKKQQERRDASQGKPSGKSSSRSDSKSGPKSGSGSRTGSRTESNSRTASKSGSKEFSKPDSKYGKKTDSKYGSKSDSKSYSKSDRPASKSYGKSSSTEGKYDKPKSFGKPSSTEGKLDKPKTKSYGKTSSTDGKYDKPKSYGKSKPGFNKTGKPFRPRLKKAPVDDGTIRLNKYIANAGICSRREADEFILTGLAEVNGKVVTEMGYKVQAGDVVRFDGREIKAEKNVYILLNKPKGFITTTKDEKDRKTVMDLVANATTARIFPVGRLDRATTGLLLFTNDGFLTKKLTHPSHLVKKIYQVSLDKKLTAADMEAIKKGVRLIPEGIAHVDHVSYIEGEPKTEVGIELHIGWNHVVRRIFENLGYEVEKLDRVAFGGLTKKNLKRGDWRKLTDKEVSFLKML